MRHLALLSLGVMVACAAPGAGSGSGLPQWRLLASPTRASLRGVSVVSRDVVWVSGSEGTCLRSLDGGRTWQRCNVPEARDRDFRDVHAFDANTAVLMAVGEPALVFRTDDGGGSWQRTFEDARPGAFLDALDFTDDQTGWVMGDPVGGAFVLARTLDGGRTWTRETAPSPLAGEAMFAASGTSLVALPRGGVLFGTGGGAVARVLRKATAETGFTIGSAPLNAGAPSRGLFSLALRGNDAIAVGGDYSTPRAAREVVALSADAGQTWRAPRGQGPRGYRSAVAFVGRGPVALAVGESGADLTRDRGETWEACGNVGYHALAFAPDGTGFAVGSGGRIARVEWAR